MANKIELLAPVGSMANLKAAVLKGADAVYLGMKRFSARDFATNFNEKYLKEAVKICRSNNVKLYLAMNTLVKNEEILYFFDQLSFAYSKGIDAVILQEISFLDIIKHDYPDLRVHISTQAGVMNSKHANLLSKADRITLARELAKEEIKAIRDNFTKELEIFCHGALCVSVSGQCLFSSLLGGRSGNRGKCAQPCRKRYNNQFYLSTKELCLIEHIPNIIKLGIDAIKIEGRMRTPYYVATVTEIYRKAIDGFYQGNFKVSKETLQKLQSAFSREFTTGFFENPKNMFNRDKSTGMTNITSKEFYEVKTKDIRIEKRQSKKKNLIVRVYNKNDAFEAASSGADIVYFDLLDKDFENIKSGIKCKLFGITPRIMLDSNIPTVLEAIKKKKPDGLFIGNLGMLNLKLDIPKNIDYNLNCFNDIDTDYFSKIDATPIISPELSIQELKQLKNKNFIVLVHGKLRLMTLRHDLEEGWIKDERGGLFKINRIMNGSEILNGKELGLLSKSSALINAGINNFYIDTDKNVGNIVRLYKKVLDGEKVDDSNIKRDYVLGWSYRGVT